MKKLLFVAVLLSSAHINISAAALPRDINSPKEVANVLNLITQSFPLNMKIEDLIILGNMLAATRKQAASSTSHKIEPALQASLDSLKGFGYVSIGSIVYHDLWGAGAGYFKKIRLRDAFADLAAGKNPFIDNDAKDVMSPYNF